MLVGVLPKKYFRLLKGFAKGEDCAKNLELPRKGLEGCTTPHRNFSLTSYVIRDTIQRHLSSPYSLQTALLVKVSSG